MRNHVLVVDDDPRIRSLVERIYARHDWKITTAASGLDGLQSLFRSPPNLVVLDILMEGMSGWETLRRIREVSDVPVLMLSGCHREIEKVTALRAGADDYLTKPCGDQELIARSEALLRRLPKSGVRHETYVDDHLEVNFSARSVKVGDEELQLTPQEYRLLLAFIHHPNQVLDAMQLLEQAWRRSIGTPDQVKVYVGYLRRKLGSAARAIETVRGFGYRYRPVRRAGSGVM